MNSASERRQEINHWMLEVFVDGGLERLDDLHVDQIDAAWGSRDRWVDAGLEALRMAVELRDAHHLDVAVVLAFSLNLPAIYPFKERRDFEAAVNLAPAVPLPLRSSLASSLSQGEQMNATPRLPLAGESALLTGAARGIGAEIALHR